MIRNSLAANDAFVDVVYTNGVGIQMIYRDSAGASAGQAGNTILVSGPVWLRLTRSGNVFSGYYSADGSNWNLIATHTTNMASNALAGLAVCDSTGLSTAVFDNVAVG